MERFRKSFIARKKKSPESSENTKPQVWLEDERKIKEGSCSFQVKYLGCIEVFESRGMQVCVEAIKALRKSKKKTQRAILYVSGDALRVSDEISKHLIVDQTIEKVSFCAPDRSHDKGFAYICRDGATRRWMCHAFLAVKESGERLSHAVGCAFAICLEKKQKRERDAVQVSHSNDDAMFARMSSFRQTSLSERLLDPQSAIVVEHTAACGAPQTGDASSSSPDNAIAIVPFGASPDKADTLPKLGSGAIPRPRASHSLVVRQTSLRLFPKLQEASPFKHNLSLRAGDTPSSTPRRANGILNSGTIPEETSADFEDRSVPKSTTPTPRVIPSTSARFSDYLSAFAFPNLAVTTSPTPTNSQTLQQPNNPPSTVTFPVDFGASDFSETVLGSESLLSSVGQFHQEPVDPFSAAPFDPATIQQMQMSHLKTHEDGMTPQPPPRASPVAENSVATSAAAFPLAQWSNNDTTPSATLNPGPFADAACLAPLAPPPSGEITPPSQQLLRTAVAPPPSTLTSARSTMPAVDSPQAPSAFALNMFGATVPVNTTTAASVSNPIATLWDAPTLPWISAGQLPPEPTSFIDDPFDLGWADRATAMARGQLAAASTATALVPRDSLFNTSMSPFVVGGGGGMTHFPASLGPPPPPAHPTSTSSTNPFLNPLLTNRP